MARWLETAPRPPCISLSVRTLWMEECRPRQVGSGRKIPGLRPAARHIQAGCGGIDLRTVHPKLLGFTTLLITDEDVHKVRIFASLGLPLAGEVVRGGDPPKQQSGATVSIQTSPLREMGMGGWFSATAPIPGDFHFPSVHYG